METLPSNLKIRVGDMAPDPVAFALDGRRITLSSLRSGNWTAYAFMRHMGCIFCREQLIELRDRKADLDRAGVHVVPVTLGSVEWTKRVMDELKIPFTPAVSPDGRAHLAFGFGPGRLLQLAGLRVIGRAIAAFVKGSGFEMPESGSIARIMPGVVVVDGQGRILEIVPAAHAGDHLRADGFIALRQRSA